MTSTLRREKITPKKLCYVIICKIKSSSVGEKTGISHSTLVIRERSVRNAIGGLRNTSKPIVAITPDALRYEFCNHKYAIFIHLNSRKLQ